MATLNGKYKVKNSQNSYDVVHLETSANQVKFDDGSNVKEKINEVNNNISLSVQTSKSYTDNSLNNIIDSTELDNILKENLKLDDNLDFENLYIEDVIAREKIEELNTTLKTKANKTELHSHTNKSVLDGITSAKVTEWNNKSTFSGNYNDLTNKPTIPTGYVDEVPKYVKDEAQKVADKVMATRNAYSLVIGATADLHTNGSDTNSNFIQHTGMGMNEVNKLTQLDLFAILGDICVRYFDDENKEGFEYVRKCFYDVIQQVPMVQMQGNHDDLSSDTTEEARQKYASFIGSNNTNSVVDFENKFRNYGYIDFDSLRFRVIHLNSADASESDITLNNIISQPQFQWLINKALDFSNKEGAEDWHFVVMCHHPLNGSAYMTALKDLLQAYINRASGTVTIAGYNVPYNFANAKQRFVCHLHGHIHNFRTEWFEDVLSITIPNACFSRNNEYGTYEGYDEWIHENFGDKDSEGNQRQFNKVKGTAQDTAFNVLVIDSRVENVIHAFNYGAGIDRTIPLDGTIYYTVSFVGQNYVSSNQATTIKEQAPYTTTISSHAGYLLESLVVTMGGIDITSSVVSDGAINIPNVTGDIKITVTTKADDSSDLPTGNFTNQILISKNLADDNIYNGIGYKDNTYVSSSGGGDTASSGVVVTGLMPYKVTNSSAKTIYIYGADMSSTNTSQRIAVFNANREYKNLMSGYDKISTWFDIEELGENYWKLTPKLHSNGIIKIANDCGAIEYIRISLKGKGADMIITFNEPIFADKIDFTNQIPLSVDVDGSQYVGTNGEDGYRVGYRISSSGVESLQDGMYCSGYIPCTAGQVIRIANITIGGPNVNYLAYYNSDKIFTIVNELTVVLPPNDEGIYNGVCTKTGFLRICCGGIDNSSILTLDEPIYL